MSLNQMVVEFNNLAQNIKFISYTDEIKFSTKLANIYDKMHDDEISADQVTGFLSNIYNLLCLSSDLRANLLESCLDILITGVNSRHSKIRTLILQDHRFLSVLIGHLVHLDASAEHKLLKILKVISELLSYSSEMNEHNLKLFIESMREYTMHESEAIRNLCFHVLVNLCLSNIAAKYIVTRTFRMTDLRNRVTDNLIGFKFFMLIEDEMKPKDFHYFLLFSFNDCVAGLPTFSVEPLKHSLDILNYLIEANRSIDFNISGQEKTMHKLNDVTNALIESINVSEDSPAKQAYFNGVFLFFNELLKLDKDLIQPLLSLTNTSMTSTGIWRSAPALKFLTTFFNAKGILESGEIVVDNILDYYTEEHDNESIPFDQRNSFYCLLEALEVNNQLSEPHLIKIFTHFSQLKSFYVNADLVTLSDDEIFMFIYFLSSLATIAKTGASVYLILSDILKMPSLPTILTKGHLSRNEDVLMVLFKLASVENYPNQKVARILSRCGSRAYGSSAVALCSSLEKRDIQAVKTKFLHSQLAEDLEVTICKINEKVDDNLVDAKFADVVQIYRHKTSHLTDQLTSVTSSLDSCTKEIAELKQKFTSFIQLSEKQEFANWCLQLDNDRLIEELKTEIYNCEQIKTSLTNFRAQIDKEESTKAETKMQLKAAVREIEQIKKDNATLEKTAQDLKMKLDKDVEALTESLEHERRLGADATNQRVKLNQKLTRAENEVQNLLQQVKRNEQEILEKQERIQQYESELKECENFKNTILTAMNTKSFKK